MDLPDPGSPADNRMVDQPSIQRGVFDPSREPLASRPISRREDNVRER